jgi:hypothetical protein
VVARHGFAADRAQRPPERRRGRDAAVIRSHRRRHLVFALALAVLLPLLLLLALRARRTEPVNPALPAAVERATEDRGAAP